MGLSWLSCGCSSTKDHSDCSSQDQPIGEENRELLGRISKKPWPVVVEIPGPEGKIERESSNLKELVRQALGIEIDI